MCQSDSVHTDEQYNEMINPAHFFRDFTCEELIDWMYLDKYGNPANFPQYVEDLLTNLEEAEMFELCGCLKEHMDLLLSTDIEEEE